MIPRWMPLLLLTLSCGLLLAPRVPAAAASGTRDEAPVCVAGSVGDIASALTDADREALRMAEQASDPALGDQRAGGLLLALIIIVIILFAIEHDHHHHIP